MNYYDSMFVENHYIKTENGVINTFNRTYYCVRHREDINTKIRAFTLSVAEMNLIRKHNIPTIIIRFAKLNEKEEEIHIIYRCSTHQVAAMPIEQCNESLSYIIPIDDLHVLGTEVKNDTRIRC